MRRLQLVIRAASFCTLLFVHDDEFVEADLAFAGFAQAVEELFHQAAKVATGERSSSCAYRRGGP